MLYHFINIHVTVQIHVTVYITVHIPILILVLILILPLPHPHPHPSTTYTSSKKGADNRKRRGHAYSCLLTRLPTSFLPSFLPHLSALSAGMYIQRYSIDRGTQR